MLFKKKMPEIEFRIVKHTHTKRMLAGLFFSPDNGRLGDSYKYVFSKKKKINKATIFDCIFIFITFIASTIYILKLTMSFF